jgi:DHA1 family inner membrane transport protein
VNTTAPGGWPRAAPEGLLACVLLAFLATAGLFYVNIMPALVAGLIDGLGFTNRQAGFVGSANVYGAACGALIAVFLVRRLPWRRVEVVALTLLLALDLVSTQVTAAAPLIALRFVHGVVGGVSVGIGLAVIARTKIPDRAFGMLLTVQYGAGGLGIMFLPRLAHQFGPKVLFLALAGFTLVTLLMLPFLADYPPRDRVAVRWSRRSLRCSCSRPRTWG